eukprot:CAMPEP_0206397336 /NCGR_PEP_ID=MMETSP0294-20121207/23395_1 /ASSEMBLY_ACC=CAM_ASM_000327 /TAXON_ID=39354 /ORGANISM="Heterosigma akashiwo, Strain CCMP2393" /LENGTH=66 /DNA_ID=CAMNT_0053852389 /DNA_START=892 /DNA_END=1092 /DNA_ORIENTATION=-
MPSVVDHVHEDHEDHDDHQLLELMVGLAVDDMLGPAVDELDQDHQLSHQVDAEANDQYGKSSHKVL